MNTQGLAASIAAELRAETARQQITGKQLAIEVHRPQNTVSRWLAGVSAFSFGDLAMMCRALDVPAFEIVQRAETALTRKNPAAPAVEDVQSVTKRNHIPAGQPPLFAARGDHIPNLHVIQRSPDSGISYVARPRSVMRTVCPRSCSLGHSGHIRIAS